MSRPKPSVWRSAAIALSAAVALLGASAIRPQTASAQPPATPQWPAPALVDDIRDLLKVYYFQRADASESDYTFRAPRGEADKKKAWKDPDTLWEAFGGGPETECHAATTDTAFLDCAGHRLAKSFNLPYGGGLTLFDASRGFYANDAYSQIAGYYALYHAFVLQFDAPNDGAYTAATARDNKQYHRRMIQAYEAHMRNIIVKHFLDPAAVNSAEYQASMTRAIGLTAVIYTAVAQAMEENRVWAKDAADRSYAIALINGINQRLFWEWVWPAKDGPPTAGLNPFGSYNDYHLAATARPELIGTDAFFWGSTRMASLRPLSQNVAPYNGLTVDSDFTVPGEWWCLGSYPAGTDRNKCLAHAAAESLGGPRSPYGQFYSDPSCTSRPGALTASSCAATSLGSIAEEWSWTFVGARKGMFLLKRLAEAGEPHTPYGAVGPKSHEVKPGVFSSEYDMVSDRGGFGVSGWHGGEGRQDDLEWEWHRDGGPAQPIRTLSAGRHDMETQNGRYSLGEDSVSAFSGGRDGDTWGLDRQDYPGGMENHAPGPHPMYGTLLFGLALWDQAADGGAGLTRSFYDTASRNHPDEFASWSKLLAASYYRCDTVADPLDPACADFGGADRKALYTDPTDGSVDLRYRYLWKDPGGWADPMVPTSHVGAGDPGGMGIPSCKVSSGLPWREVYDFTGGQGYLVDEGGFGAYNSLVQGFGGFMRLAAARYPLAAPDPSLAAEYAAQRTDVLKPWYDLGYTTVDGILGLYRDEVGGYGYVPDIENSACRGEDPTAPGQYMMLTWRHGTGDSVHQTTIRRAKWYSILAVWYLWYDSSWLDVDPDVWISR